MVIRRKEQRKEVRSNVRDGSGEITLAYRVPREVFHHEKAITEMTIPPGASIGFHQHTGETEYYIIRSGQGLVNDDGEEVIVRHGDCIITGNGSSHGIKNTGLVPLVVDAIMVAY